MENTVTIEVTSAFLVEGEVVLPGQTVEMLRTEALALVARGKAVLSETGEAGASAQDEDDPGAAGKARGRGKRGQG